MTRDREISKGVGAALISTFMRIGSTAFVSAVLQLFMHHIAQKQQYFCFHRRAPMRLQLL